MHNAENYGTNDGFLIIAKKTILPVLTFLCILMYN